MSLLEHHQEAKSKTRKGLYNFFTHVILALSLISCTSQSSVKEPTSLSNKVSKNVDIDVDFTKGIISIYEDTKGNYWIGSKEEGVCKIDGKNSTYYTIMDGLPSNFVREIKEDEMGNIWFTTGAGISFFDGNKITTVVDYRNAESASTIPSSYQAESWSLDKNDLWFTKSNSGVWRYHEGTVDNLRIPVPREDTKYDDDRTDKPYHYPYAVITIYRDDHAKLWLGTFNRGVVGYDGKSFEYHNPNNFGVGTVRSIYQDKNGTYWMASNGGGVYTYDGHSYINFTAERGLTSSNPDYDEAGTLSRVWSMEQDNEGNMWFGTADAGLWKFDGKEMTNYTTKDGLPHNFVKTIYKDRSGQLWFCSGMESHGFLYTLHEGVFESINP